MLHSHGGHVRESDVAFVTGLAAQHKLQPQGSLLFAAVEACIRADCIQSAYTLIDAAVCDCLATAL